MLCSGTIKIARDSFPLGKIAIILYTIIVFVSLKTQRAFLLKTVVYKMSIILDGKFWNNKIPSSGVVSAQVFIHFY